MCLKIRYFFLLFLSLPALAQTSRTGLQFTSSKKQLITVYKGTIFVNGNRAYQLPPDAVLLNSRRNRIIEDKGNVFLFLEVDGKPNKNRLYVFGINNSKADSLLSAVSSDVKDMDQDGLLEFGGSEVAQTHPASDSMYYVPSKYYEISRGQILFDKEYTEKIDKKVNGVYIENPLDENGNCCKVIPKPKGRS